MKLRYWDLSMDYDWYISYDNKMRYGFQCNTGFINYYLSKEIRKLKYETNGKYKSLLIILLPKELIKQKNVLYYDNSLRTYLPFDEEQYNKIKETDDFSFYLNLIREGIEQARDFEQIPYKEMKDIVDRFEKSNCVTEWIHKKKRFKELDLQIILRCEFTRECFQVRMIANSIKRKEKLTEGIIMRTEPDPILFDGLYKDIELVGDKIVFTSRFTLFYYVDVADLQAGRFSVSIKGQHPFLDWMKGIDYAEATLVPEKEFIYDACDLFKK